MPRTPNPAPCYDLTVGEGGLDYGVSPGRGIETRDGTGTHRLMALNFFKKKKSDDDASGPEAPGGNGGAGDAGGEGASEGFQRDPRKARRFFEHAQATADSRQYDYAIECYINGLRHDPDNMAMHEALFELARKRKVAGGKPASMAEKMKGGGKSAIDKMLHEEKVFAKDIANAAQMRNLLKRAVEAAEAEPDLHLREFAHSLGNMALVGLQRDKKTDAKTLTSVGDLMARIQSFALAVHAYRLAGGLRPEDGAILQRLKELEAETVIHTSGYEESSRQEGGFRQVVKDMDKQRELEQADSLAKTEDMKEQLVKRYRAEFQNSREDLTIRMKLVKALRDLETEDAEDEAIALLKEAFEQTGEYRLKVEIGDIRTRQMNRQLRMLKQAVDASPDDQAMRAEYEKLLAEKSAFELKEYADRVDAYPTDLGLRFELGKRLFAAGRHEEAIAQFQQSKNEARNRAMSHDYLGQCYRALEWHELAVETLQEGIAAHPLDDDRVALELRYQLLLTLMDLARQDDDLEKAREAQKLASFILQKDIKYRDIRDRMNQSKQLVEELRNKA